MVCALGCCARVFDDDAKALTFSWLSIWPGLGGGEMVGSETVHNRRFTDWANVNQGVVTGRRPGEMRGW